MKLNKKKLDCKKEYDMTIKPFLGLSIRSYLRSIKKMDDNVENLLKNLSLEELIWLKLELSINKKNRILTGLPILKEIPRISKSAVIMFAITASNNINEAASILGSSSSLLKKEFKKLNLTNRLESIKSLLGEKGIYINPIKNFLVYKNEETT